MITESLWEVEDSPVALIVWSDEMSVGVELLDEHHRRLVDLLNTLTISLETGDTDEVIGGVLDELVRYALYHFTEEERLMEEAKFPGLEGHMRSHEALTARVSTLVDEYQNDPGTVTATELRDFLADWLVHHICNEDALYRKAMVAANL